MGWSPVYKGRRASVPRQSPATNPLTKPDKKVVSDANAGYFLSAFTFRRHFNGERMTAHRQLLAEYANTGSEEAFREIVVAYIGIVHGCALRLVNGNSQLAEDIAQTVFTDLGRRAKTLSPEVIVGGWLHRRTCYAAAAAMRRATQPHFTTLKVMAMTKIKIIGITGAAVLLAAGTTTSTGNSWFWRTGSQRPVSHRPGPTGRFG